jgi:ribosomal protein S18 acetylase RimI-like enzyme
MRANEPSLISNVRDATAPEISARLGDCPLPGVELGLVLEDHAGAVAFKAEPFDSELFGLQIGRIVGLTAATELEYEALLLALLNRAKGEGYAQILRRTGINCLEEIWALGRCGFQLMDVGLVFGRTLPGGLQEPRYSDLVVRQAHDADVEAIVHQMLDTPWGSRYEADPDYSIASVRALRTRWLWNSQRGRATAFLVGVLDGQPAGYVTCLVDQDARRGEIELVGTLPSHRGRKVASRVVEHALAWFSARVSFVTVRTQATNYAAAALYEKCGFTLHASDITFRYRL